MELASPVIVVMFDSEQIVTSADRRCTFFENAGASDSLAASCVCNPDTDVCFGLHGSPSFQSASVSVPLPRNRYSNSVRSNAFLQGGVCKFIEGHRRHS